MNTRLFADTEAGLVVVRSDPRPDTAPQIELADVSTGKRLRRLLPGFPMAAADHTLLAQTTGCQNGPRPKDCEIARVDLDTGRTTGSYPIVDGQYPGSTAVFSSDLQTAVFQLGRTAPDPRFEQSQVTPPADIVLLHLDTSILDVVPGLEISPDASVGLALDASGAAVVASFSLGDRVELLAWRPGMTGPGLIAQIDGAFDNTAPAILLTRPQDG